MQNCILICKRLSIVLMPLFLLGMLFACSNEVDDSLHVLSYNMKFESQAGGGDPVYTWEKRLPGIVRSFSDYKANIIGTQELEKWQLDELMDSLDNRYDYVGESRYLENDEHSAIIYDADRFEYLEGDTLWLSETPEQRGSKSWDSAHPRIVTFGKFLDTNTDTEFYVFNTHLDHRSAEAREQGLSMIVEMMVELQEYPIVLTGDFNMHLDSENFAPIHEYDEMFTDTFTPFEDEFDPDGLTSHGFMGGTEGEPIDFIFYSVDYFSLEETLIVRDKWEDRYYLSDHYPVYSQFNFKK